MTEEELIEIANKNCIKRESCKGCPLEELQTSNVDECVKKGVDIIYILLGIENVNRL